MNDEQVNEKQVGVRGGDKGFSDKEIQQQSEWATKWTRSKWMRNEENDDKENEEQRNREQSKEKQQYDLLPFRGLSYSKDTNL